MVTRSRAEVEADLRRARACRCAVCRVKLDALLDELNEPVSS